MKQLWLMLLSLVLTGCATTGQGPPLTPAAWVETHQGVMRVAVQGAVTVALATDPGIRAPLVQWVSVVQRSAERPTTLQAVKQLFLDTLPQLKLPPEKAELLQRIVPLVVNAVELVLQEAKVPLNDQDVLPITRQIVGWIAAVL